jgi:hypothetical protein
MTVIITGPVNYEMVNSFIGAIEESLNRNELLTIYFSSEGGMATCVTPILEILNAHKDLVELVAFDEISSAAFIIFFSATCKKRITSSTISIVHNSFIKSEIDSWGNIKNIYDKKIMESLKYERVFSYKFYKDLGLSEDELLRLKKGEDIIFIYKRLNELLNGKITKQRKSNIIREKQTGGED